MSKLLCSTSFIEENNHGINVLANQLSQINHVFRSNLSSLSHFSANWCKVERASIRRPDGNFTLLCKK